MSIILNDFYIQTHIFENKTEQKTNKPPGPAELTQRKNPPLLARLTHT